VVFLRGEHDAFTSGLLANALATAISDDDHNLVLDLSEVVFMGAATVGVIVRAREFLRVRGRVLTVRSPSSQARRVVQLCGAGDLVESAAADELSSAGALGTWVTVPAHGRQGP
jgi:anti-anti-sigma factor